MYFAWMPTAICSITWDKSEHDYVLMCNGYEIILSAILSKVLGNEHIPTQFPTHVNAYTNIYINTLQFRVSHLLAAS